MGVVWRAEDERLARTVAIKQLLTRPGLSESQAEDVRRRAMREARTAARLQHRNAIAVFDVADHDGNPWLVLEFLRSQSLSAVLAERGPLPAAEVARIGAQVAAALAAAHEAGIVHRDVKPGNILLDDEGVAKITDFGISRTLDDGTITQTGMIAGTPAYLAPEVARGKEPGRESDVFSLGATLYHAIEGTPPFGTNTNALALLHAVASGNVPPPSHAGLLTPALMGMLAAEPGVRPSMNGVASSLASLETQRLDEQRTVPVRPSSLMQPVKRPAMPVMQPVVQPGPTRDLPKLEPAELGPATPAPAGSRRLILIGALVAVFAVAGVLAAVLITSANRPGTASGLSPSSQPPSSTAPRSSAPPATQVQGPISWQSAGELVINYYSGTENRVATWAMLGRNGRATFVDQAGFERYWGQFKQVSARNARGVTPNQDGSVNVPVDVTYTTSDGANRQVHKILRVVNEDGHLAIDSDAR
jgi:serine/threonine protein kinase